jgi:hypothetical protein
LEGESHEENVERIERKEILGSSKQSGIVDGSCKFPAMLLLVPASA